MINCVSYLKEKGFLLNELYREMDEHILDQFTLKGIYEKM